MAFVVMMKPFLKAYEEPNEAFFGSILCLQITKKVSETWRGFIHQQYKGM